jgi:hypothetical protein
MLHEDLYILNNISISQGPMEFIKKSPNRLSRNMETVSAKYRALFDRSHPVVF